MGTAAQAAIQDRIGAQETLSTIEYGIRSIEACRGRWYTGEATHERQILAACAAAGIERTERSLRALKAARGEARESLKAATAACKQIGTARQLRLALAGEREAAMA